MQYKVISNIRSNGVNHLPGDIIDMFGDEADQLVKSGALEPMAQQFSGVVGVAPKLTTSVSDLVGKIAAAGEQLKGQMAYLDSSIDEAFQRRDILLASPVSKADFMAYIRNDIRRIGEHHRKTILKMVSEHSKRYTDLDRAINREGGSFAYLTGDSIEPAQPPYVGLSMTKGAMFWYFGDLIEKRFEDAISTLEWVDDALPVEQRREIVASIDAEIADLRKQRQALADQLIEAGLAG